MPQILLAKAIMQKITLAPSFVSPPLATNVAPSAKCIPESMAKTMAQKLIMPNIGAREMPRPKYTSRMWDSMETTVMLRPSINMF